jgi:lipopolysaccharide export system permease protein
MTDFFPSRTITLYMVRLFLVRTFAILAGLVLVLQALDLLSQTGNILAYKGNGQAEVWRYVSLRAPQIIATFLPFSVLLGTILTLAQMNQNSEVIAMKASGLSAHQILAPLVAAALGVALVSFGFNDRVVSRATAVLTQWQDVDYGPLPIDRGDRTNVWVLAGDDLLRAQQVRGRGDQTRLGNVSFYERTNGALQGLITAPLATRFEDGWRIERGSRFDVKTGKATPLGPTVIARGVRSDQLTLADVDPDALSLGALYSAIQDLKESGRPTKALEGSLWHKLAGPLSAILMPILGAVAGFGIARSGQLFVRAVIGMGLGFAYFVADNFALAMGNLGAYPPFLAAWAPFLLFLLIGEAVLFRTEE